MNSPGVAARLRSLVRGQEILLVPLAILTGGIAGLAVTAMSWAAQFAHVILFGIALDVRLSARTTVPVAAALLAPTAGGGALGVMEYLRRRWRIQTPADPVEANALRGGHLSLRDSLVVSGQTLLSNGCGASVGLEAGYAQIGAGLASRLGRTLKLRRNDLRLLVGCGAAGAIGAAFDAPLAGALYACELIIGGYSVRSAGPVLSAALTAVLLTGLFGVHPYSLSVHPGEAPNALAQALALSGLALAAGALGIGIMYGAGWLERTLKRAIPYLVRPALGGLAVGALALLTPQVLAAGHGAMALDMSLRLTVGALVGLVMLKVIACTVSLASGFRGGLFFASLFVGALMGQLYATLLAGPLAGLGAPIDPTVSAVTGMAGLATAIVGAPLTMVLLVLEMTRSVDAAAAALPVCLLSNIFVRGAFGHSFSTWRLHLQGETIGGADDIGWLRALTVGSMMRTDVALAPVGRSVADCRSAFPLGSRPAIFVQDKDGGYLGLVLLSDLFSGRFDGPAGDVPIEHLARCADAALSPDMNVRGAMLQFEKAEADLLAVLAPSRTVLGYLTEAFARRRYIEELDGVMAGSVFPLIRPS